MTSVETAQLMPVPRMSPPPQPGSETPSDRLETVLEAVVTIAVDPALDRIVHAARRLTDARFGALALMGADGAFGDVVTSGLSAEDHPDLVGLGPIEAGVLGHLALEQQPLRLSGAQLGDEPAMQSFLGVPIRIGDEVFGLLWLTEKAGGAFSVEDERLIVALATAAGTTIGNARLYVAAEQRRRWLEAAGEITAHLLADGDRDTALALVAGRAREVAQADAAFVALPAHDGETLVFEVVDGLRSGPWRGFEVPIKGSVSGDVLRTGTSVMATDAMSAARAVQPDYAPPRGARVHGPLMVVPLGAGPLRGVLLLAREIGRLPFTDDELNLATSFAGHARWRWSTRGHVRTARCSPCTRTATASPATYTTWSSSGCSPPACSCTGCAGASRSRSPARSSSASVTWTRPFATSARRSSTCSRRQRVAPLRTYAPWSTTPHAPWASRRRCGSAGAAEHGLPTRCARTCSPSCARR
jgi:GAF domain-containing protein